MGRREGEQSFREKGREKNVRVLGVSEEKRNNESRVSMKHETKNKTKPRMLTLYESLPDMQRSSSNGVDGILSNDVEGREHTIPLLLTKNVEESLPRSIDGSSLGSLLFLDLGLSTDTRDSEEKLSDEGDGGLLKVEEEQRSARHEREREKVEEGEGSLESSSSRRPFPSRAREGANRQPW